MISKGWIIFFIVMCTVAVAIWVTEFKNAGESVPVVVDDEEWWGAVQYIHDENTEQCFIFLSKYKDMSGDMAMAPVPCTHVPAGYVMYIRRFK